MKHLALLFLLTASLHAQNEAKAFDAASAERFAKLALACVHLEYPNKISHTMNSDADAAPPRRLTPAFYGCYDWHSSVHGHWLLARLARTYPNARFAAPARVALRKSITKENVAEEVKYLKATGRASFERPYGLAWLLQLGLELREWGSATSNAEARRRGENQHGEGAKAKATPKAKAEGLAPQRTQRNTEESQKKEEAKTTSRPGSTATSNAEARRRGGTQREEGAKAKATPKAEAEDLEPQRTQRNAEESQKKEEAKTIDYVTIDKGPGGGGPVPFTPEMDAKQLSDTMRPLEEAAVERLKTWLPKLSHPVRSGEHSQTAFALGLMLDYARGTGDKEFEKLLIEKARAFYGKDVNCPLDYEPSGEDFLSPCIAEADVMRRVLAQDEYAKWLLAFLPVLGPKKVSTPGAWLLPAVVTDPSDPKLAHLDGLNLSRAWMLEGIASAVKEAIPQRRLLAAAMAHRQAGLASVTGEHYEGGHWLGSFAVYLVTQRGITSSR